MPHFNAKQYKVKSKFDSNAEYKLKITKEKIFTDQLYLVFSMNQSQIHFENLIEVNSKAFETIIFLIYNLE